MLHPSAIQPLSKNPRHLRHHQAPDRRWSLTLRGSLRKEASSSLTPVVHSSGIAGACPPLIQAELWEGTVEDVLLCVNLALYLTTFVFSESQIS